MCKIIRQKEKYRLGGENEMNENNFYVYEHIRLDNNSCFYVGKGHGRRHKHKSRNEHHDRIVKKHGMRTNIIKYNLSEQEALSFEKETIENYVFNRGYGIDIAGYRKTSGNMLTNQTFGGDGTSGIVHSEEWKKQHSIDMTGKNNPMYGVNLWDSYSYEKQCDMKNRLSKLNTGENNPMYGISPKKRMDEKTYKKWKEKVSNRCKQLTGNKNPNYGNKKLHNKVKDDPDLRLKYYSRKGSKNGRCVPVSVYKDDILIITFDYIGQCAEWMINTLSLDLKINTIRIRILEAIKETKPYKGFIFK